ncbi:16S rRNA (guanine(966)-N(2))-methyltransferase RsmD [Seongchinamella sediminis]|uniref:Ribosomal RNA small subunit methyltransferase D n=1 Tax=Seongchinamella sediminis TaxID=2283635 RepID=A0A3L7DUW9_9GAMM|nr:16S rRNA (guanine(966)-N(2))-methyltransferase RsmD [Seongchinamella sediminis]RLQ20916.1 16S rRNA (guanine(966)-N(2))-methyltransferase RsmD [Seongchinamella sediminis]
MSQGTKARGKGSQLRIIGGQWRGRKLTFQPVAGLRPTPDRVRETLFNWLAPDIHGARCLDLFAGSGALGLEALSRGAASCDFVDRDSAALGQIEHHLNTLGARERGHCHRIEAASFLERAASSWDIVFIDPPFGLDLVGPSCELLAGRQQLSANGLVYIETGAREQLPDLPATWALHREKRAGEVCYRLFVVAPA